MQTLIQLIKPYKKRIILVALLDALGMIMALLMPFVMSETVDRGIAQGDIGVIIIHCVLMLVIAAVSLFGSLSANKLNNSVMAGYTRDVQRATFAKINRLSYSAFSRLGPSGLLTRVTDDIWNIEGAISSLVYTAVTVPVMLVGSAVLAFIRNATLAVVFILSLPPVMLLVWLLLRPLYGMWELSDKFVDDQNRIVRERLSGIRVVRAFNSDLREHERARHATEEMAKYMIRANVRGGYIEPFAMLLLNLATVLMVAVAGGMADVGALKSAGDIVALVQYVMILAGALLNLSWTVAWLPRLRVAIKRIGEIHSETDEGSAKSETLPSGFALEVRGLYFAYPDSPRDTLEDISISVKEGERVAIIGGTGSGKTTLTRLLVGLYSTDRGEIMLGGVDYRRLSLDEIRSHFSVALQRSMIFEGTVRENLLLGDPDADDEKILEALSDAEMRHFIEETKGGLDYLLVGMGRNVSGGQKQRLNIARAILRPADIYLFDDSFSALDFLTERRIREALEKRLSGKSVITVTQRVASAMHADRIYVIDGGRIVGSGTHRELLISSDIYREIAYSQLGEGVNAGA